MKRTLLILIFVFVFTLPCFALEGYDELGIVQPFTIDSVSSEGIVINGTLLPFNYGSGVYYDGIVSAFNLQNNCLVTVESIRGSEVDPGNWLINCYVSRCSSLDNFQVLEVRDRDDWACITFDLSVGNNQFGNPQTYRIQLEVDYNGNLISSYEPSMFNQLIEYNLYNQSYADYYNIILKNYTDFGIGFCGNPLIYNNEVIYDGQSDPPEEPEPGTPEYDSLIDALIDIPRRLGEAIGNVIRSIFLPSEDFLTSKYNSIRENFVFADSIINLIEKIQTSLNDLSDEPPVITLDLSSADSKYNWGGEVISLDLSWYSKYKPFVDTILSSILILFFVWRVFIHLPGIISGLPGVIREVS